MCTDVINGEEESSERRGRIEERTDLAELTAGLVSSPPERWRHK